MTVATHRDHHETNPLVSIVVTTRNEEDKIARCLSSILAQSYSPIELIVVDNNSADSTKEISQHFTRLVFDYGPERSAQRNFGLLRVARGSIFGYIDADMILGPRVVESAVQALLTGAVGVYIPEIVLGNTRFAKARRFERSFYDATPIDAVRFFDAQAFRRSGGFDELIFATGSGEDWDLDNSLELVGQLVVAKRSLESEWGKEGWPLATTIRQLGIAQLHSEVIYHDESSDSWGSYWRKKYYYTKGFQGYREKWGKNHPRVQSQFSFRYRYITVFLSNSGTRKLLRHPILATYTVILRFGVGFAYVLRQVKERLRND